MSTLIKNVAIAGATGVLGAPVFTALTSSNLFNITVLTRAGSTHSFPPSVTVKSVDYTSLSSLTNALANQHALVSTLGAGALPSQPLLIDACISASVPVFLPSEFGSDTLNPLSAKLPVFKAKIETQEYLKKKAAEGKIAYTTIHCGPFLEWGLGNGFVLDVKGKKGRIPDGGEQKFSATRLSTVGKAVVGVLTQPEETKNRGVYVQDLAISQNRLVEVAKKVTGPDGWDLGEVDTAEVEKESYEKLKKGQVDMSVWIGFLVRAIWAKDYGGDFSGRLDNELFGIKELTEGELEDVIKGIVKA